MKNKYLLRFLMVLYVCFLGLSVYAQEEIRLTANGVEPVELAEMIEFILPSDYKEAIFDATDAPIMDSLYVIMSDGEMDGCLIWSKDGDAYTIDLMDDSNLFFVGMECRTLTNVGGKKLYFTGVCDTVSTGTDDSEGFIYVKGTDGDKVDIYLHDFRIKSVDKTLGTKSFNDLMRGYMRGMACPIAIGTDGEMNDAANIFTTRFHIRGENRLTGGAASRMDPATSGVMQVLSNIMYMVASPIAIRPTMAEGVGKEDFSWKTAKLTFDDKWPTSVSDPTAFVRTNGILDLPVEGELGTPSIDLGNAQGQCEFDGGQYMFHTPRNNSMFYVCTMAICYKYMSLMGSSTYGIGSSVSTGSSSDNLYQYKNDVIIHDGTFMTHPATTCLTSPKDSIKVNVVARGWYKDSTDLRLPFNAKINGGTFNNCRPYRCDASGEQGMTPQNSVGELLGRDTIEVAAPQNGVSALPADVATQYPAYGGSSLTPVLKDGKYYVYPYLPGIPYDDAPTDIVRNWVTLIPQLGMDSMLTMGGDVTVEFETKDGTERPIHNSYLFYAELSKETRDNASVNIGIPITVDMAYRYGGDSIPDIRNESPYVIEKALYSMLPFYSNQWYTICMPYNVQRIYVMETTDTQRQAGESLTDFLVRQGEADGKLAQQIITSLCPDIFSKKGSGVNMNLIEIAKTQIDCPPYRLIPFNPSIAGHDRDNANFYLYEQVSAPDPEDPEAMDSYVVPDGGVGLWNLNDKNVYTKQWQPAFPRTITNDEDENIEGSLDSVWMQRGRIYSIFLPAGEDRYWDGKYLIFEGEGPQTVNGKPVDGMFMTQEQVSFDNWGINAVALQGNNTFGNYFARSENGPIFIPEKSTSPSIYYTFRKETTDSTLIRPLKVYAVSPNGQDIVEMTSRGIIRRSDLIDNTTSHQPIVGDILLEAYTHQDNIILTSHAEQYVQVVSVDGRMLFAGLLHDGEQKQIATKRGVYIVRSEEQAIKLLVQ